MFETVSGIECSCGLVGIKLFLVYEDSCGFGMKLFIVYEDSSRRKEPGNLYVIDLTIC